MPASLSRGPRVGYDLERVGAGLSRGPNRKKTMADAAWSGTWPAPGATLDLDFANNRGMVRGSGQGGVMDAITFTRASSGTYIDSAGLLQTAASGAARFDWGRPAVVAGNLLSYTENFTNTYWQNIGGQVTNRVANQAAAPDGATTADLIYGDAGKYTAVGPNISDAYAAGSAWTYSIYVKAQAGSPYGFVKVNLTRVGSGSECVIVDLSNGAFTLYSSVDSASAAVADAGGGWYRVSHTLGSLSVSGTWSANAVRVFAMKTAAQSENLANGDGVSTSGIYVWGAQFEVGSVATDYKPVAQPTINTPMAANATCNGILIEEQRTNRLLRCRDATQADWVKTNVTPTLDQTGIDGVASSATRLTATAGDATCTQAVTLASGSRACAVYLKRITGTGAVQVTLDGVSYSTADLSGGTWCRIAMQGTVTNPVVGVKIATSGDEVALDYAQLEDGTFSTSPILTTTASATRNADFPSIPAAQAEAKLFLNRAVSIYAEYQRRAASSGHLYKWGQLLRCSLGTTQAETIVSATSAGSASDSLGTRNKQAASVSTGGANRHAVNGVSGQTSVGQQNISVGGSFGSGELSIGCFGSNNSVINSCIGRLVVVSGRALLSSESLREWTR